MSSPAEPQKLRKSTQVIAGIIITMGGFILGTSIGWSSPAEKNIIKATNITKEQFSWIASSFPVGAAFSQILAALLMDVLGRKYTIFLLSIATTGSWLILLLLEKYATYIVGRLLLGLFGGGFCVVCPTMVGEIAHKSIRGFLGVLFQFQVVIGITFSYAFAYVDNLLIFHIACLVAPAALPILLLLLVPESPLLYVMKGKEEAAKKSLVYYRGKNYNIDAEMEEFRKLSIKTEVWKTLKTRASKRSILMLLGLHVIQQVTGINAVMYYAHQIFEITKTPIPGNLSALIFAVGQIIMTGIAAAVVDRAGRKTLWYVSVIVMGICQGVLGAYFTLHRVKPAVSAKIGVIPTIAVCLYVCGFAIGTGPLPWMMIGELLPTNIKATAATMIAFVNWMLAFLVTLSFPYLQKWIGIDMICYMFAGFCVLGIFFIIFCVIETKVMSLDEIQAKLEEKKERKGSQEAK